MQSTDYRFRFYRSWMEGRNLSRIRLIRGESDILVFSEGDHQFEADQLLRQARNAVEKAVSDIPEFLDSMSPLAFDSKTDPIVSSMLCASSAWNVGPMASVAGAIAEHVARGLSFSSRPVFVENGGDTFALASDMLTFQVYAGVGTPFPREFGFTVDASPGISVCTSSGRIGPSWSAGSADAVVAVAADGAVADAAATSIANRICGEDDVSPVMESVTGRHGLKGLIIMAGKNMGVWGDLEITKLKGA